MLASREFDWEAMMDDRGMAFVDGEYVTPTNAKISVFDNGFSECDMVYDVTSTWKGQFFRLDDHVDRFLRSCEGVRLVCPYSAGEIKHILAECVHRGKVGEASYVDVILTRGLHRSWIGGITPDLRDTDVTFVAYAIPYVWIVPYELQETGMTFIIAKTPRIPEDCVDARFKNAHWGDLNRARFEAIDAGVHNAILCTPEGYLSEGPGFNIFWAKGGTLYTPGRNVLQGITRLAAIDLAKEEGITLERGDYPPEALLDADEAFICSTAGGIMPVVRVDDRTLSNGAPGPISSSLRKRYWEKREAGWLGTPVTDLIETAELA